MERATRIGSGYTEQLWPEVTWFVLALQMTRDERPFVDRPRIAMLQPSPVNLFGE
jgi:hypothetical protein